MAVLRIIASRGSAGAHRCRVGIQPPKVQIGDPSHQLTDGAVVPRGITVETFSSTSHSPLLNVSSMPRKRNTRLPMLARRSRRNFFGGQDEDFL